MESKRTNPESKVPVLCQECGREFKDGRGLQGHLRMGHKMEITDVSDSVSKANRKGRISNLTARILDTKAEIEKINDAMQDIRDKHSNFFGEVNSPEQKDLLQCLTTQKDNLLVNLKQLVERAKLESNLKGLR